MAELLDIIRGRLDEGTIEGLSREVGSDAQTVRRVASMAVPMLIGGLSRNVHASPQARSSLNAALENDHDGSLLDRLGSLLGGGGAGAGGLGGLAGAVGGLLGGGAPSGTPSGAARAADGDGILRHVLGDRRDTVEESAARASGMDRAQVGRLLGMLAPLVMGALGKVKKERNLSEEQVADIVDRERRDLERATPDAGEGDLERSLASAGPDDLASLADRLAGAFLSPGGSRG